MIDTHLEPARDVVRHACVGPVTTMELLSVINASGPVVRNTLWDFRRAELKVPLNVINSPSYPKVRDLINARWQHRRMAFLVEANIHKHMIEIFMNEGGLDCERRIFFQLQEAESWLGEGAARISQGPNDRNTH